MAAPPRKAPAREPPRWLNPAATLAVVLGLLLAVYLLPPDTSLAEVRRVGILKVCVPTEHPPLVTGKADAPGFDVELLGLAAKEMGLTLQLNTNTSMGRDINPRNWRLNRAQCQIIGGGVIASPTTRSYLDTTPAFLEAGWAVVEPAQHPATLDGASVGFLAGFSGFDRIALGRFLRAQGANIDIVNSREELVRGLTSGAFALGVTESLGAGTIARDNGWTVSWLSNDLAHYPLAYGLWKGDLTLKRALQAALAKLEASGEVKRLIEKYELLPIATTFGGGAGA